MEGTKIFFEKNRSVILSILSFFLDQDGMKSTLQQKWNWGKRYFVSFCDWYFSNAPYVLAFGLCFNLKMKTVFGCL